MAVYGFTALVSLGIIKFGGRWGTGFRPGWFGRHWWWVAVTAAAGVVVGLLRRLTRLPEEVPGFFEDLKAEHFDARLVPGTVAVSAVSLIGGASVGPEKVLASMGAGAGSWLARRRELGDEDSQVNTMAGIAGIFGGVFSSPVIVVMLILEVARPGRTAVQQDPGHGHRGRERLLRDLLRHRRRGVPGRLPGAAVRVRGLAAARPASPLACSGPWWRPWQPG
jgi:H+/Cl- antiporter ClcA